jgi:predicted CXXCH cytochrome family protein
VRFSRTSVTLVLSLAAICHLLACAESTRYKVLTFFFEGVPKPGEPVDTEKEAELTKDAGDAQSALAALNALKPSGANARVVRLHPPYKTSRCGACHSGEAGSITRTPQEGLCRQCHDVPGDARYVHGPVAVDDCLYCHHHHGGQNIYMLRVPPEQLCIECHDEDDLTEGEYHATLETKLCIDCHSGHGGDDRYFLKKSDP